MTLQGRIALVTGGASGIGLAIAKALHRDGAHVAIADLDGVAASDAGAAGGGFGARVDVGDEADLVRFVNRVEIFALQIFNQCNLKRRFIIKILDDDGNLMDLRGLRCAPAAFPGDYLILPGQPFSGANDKGLQNAMLGNRFGEFLYGLRLEGMARLHRGG